jgi:cell division ATPase FtsA
MAGRKDVNGKLEILGTGKVESVGVIRGVVSNIEKTVNAITGAITEAERRADHAERDRTRDELQCAQGGHFAGFTC